MSNITSFPTYSIYDINDPSCVNAGDTAFMIMATAFVMLQTPAMGIAQAGLIRRKNALSMLMQVMTGTALQSVMWCIFGFTLVFGPSKGGMIGSMKYTMLNNVPIQGCFQGQTIPGMIYVAFQMMFALMTPVIVTGAWAERMTYNAFLVFMVLWPILVYYPLAHWIWNTNGWLFKGGAIDFAGGTVIHAATGAAALVVITMLEKRKSHLSIGGGHNIPFVVLGGSIIWAGWYSFNGGSALAANGIATTAVTNTHLSASCGALVWSILFKIIDGKWHVCGIINGALAGLAAITPGSGYVEPWAACIIGILAGICAFFTVKLRERFELDDVCDVVALQGTPGSLGCILAGFFAKEIVGGRNGVFYGTCADFKTVCGSKLLGWQVAMVVSGISWSMFWTWIIMIVIRHTVGMDISAEMEELGLDVTQIGAKAYDYELSITEDLGKETINQKFIDAASSGNVQKTCVLLDAGADINHQDYDGRSAIHLAAAGGHESVVTLLLQKGIAINSVDKYGHTPLSDAIEGNMKSVVNILITSGASVVDNIIIEEKYFDAISKNDKTTVATILHAGLDVNTSDYDYRTGLHIAVCEGYSDIINILFQYNCNYTATDRFGRTPIEDAIKYNNNNVISIFKDKGIINSTNRTSNNMNYLSCEMNNNNLESAVQQIDLDDPYHNITYNVMLADTRELLQAASFGNIDEIQRLINKGADPSCFDYDRRTPLHVACNHDDNIEIVKILLQQKKVCVNALDRWKHTPLQEALSNRAVKIAKLLRSHHATMIIDKTAGYKLCRAAAQNELSKLEQLVLQYDINSTDYDMRTALHLSAAEGHLDTVKWLLNNGANQLLTDRYGNTPRNDAERGEYKNIVELL